MKIIYTPTTRGDILDRNPTYADKQFASGAVAPHTSTLRGTYTVPAGRSAYVSYVVSTVIRMTAAGSPGLVMCNLQLYRPDPGLTTFVIRNYLQSNQVYANSVVHTPVNVYMEAGDQLYCYDEDGSTGGTVQFINEVFLTLFDA